MPNNNNHGTKREGKRTYNRRKPDEHNDKKVRPFKQEQDVTWYELDRSTTETVAAIPFNRFPGLVERPLIPYSGTAYKVQDDSIAAQPGVCALTYIPGPGTSLDSTSPINIASTATWGILRSRFSGSRTYEKSDVQMYLGAMEEIYLAYYEAVRILRVAQTYVLVNRNIPEVLARALGVNLDDVRSNIANYRGQLAILASQIGSLAVPDYFKVFQRRAFVGQNIFCDSTSNAGQFYVFVRAGSRIYDPTHTGGGALIFDKWSANSRTGGVGNLDSNGDRLASAIINELKTLVAAVIEDEDINTMSGDIAKAFGAEHCYVLQVPHPDEVQSFVYDENVLEQIQNCHTMIDGVNYSNTNFDITQNNNIIYYLNQEYDAESNAQTALTRSLYEGSTYLNSHKDDVSPLDVLEWTRCTMGVRPSPNGASKFYLVTGLETIIMFQMWTHSYESGNGIMSYNGHTVSVFNPTSTTSVIQAYKYFWPMYSKFDWHPITYFGHATGSSPTTVHFSTTVGDLRRYTMVSNADRVKLHEYATLGAYGQMMLTRLGEIKQGQ